MPNTLHYLHYSSYYNINLVQLQVWAAFIKPTQPQELFTL